MKKHFFALAGFLIIVGCKEKPGDVGSAAPGTATEEQGVILAVEGQVMPVGQVHSTEFNMGMEGGKIKIKMSAQEMDGTVSMSETKKRKIESIGEGKYRITLEQEKKVERSTMMGQEQPTKETVNPLQGLSVIAEKGADGSWVAKLESGEASPEMQPELAEIADELNKDTNLKIYGTAARKVGDEWEVSGEDMLGIEGAKGTIKVKFEAIEDFQGERCAKLSGKLDLSGKPEGDAPEGMVLRMSGDFLVFRSIEHREDLQHKMTGKMEVSGDLEPQPGMKMSMRMEGPLESLGNTVISDAK